MTNAKKLRAKLKRKADTDLEEILNDSDTETIQYAEPYKNTSKAKDEIYRKKVKKKAIKILTKKKKKSIDGRDSPIRHATDPRLASLWTDDNKPKTFSKRDQIFRKKSQK